MVKKTASVPRCPGAYACTSLPVGRNYGLVSTGGVARTAWLDVTAVTNPGLRPLAEAVMHASVFQTAFHNQSNNNLEKFSTGDYVYADNTNETPKNEKTLAIQRRKQYLGI